MAISQMIVLITPPKSRAVLPNRAFDPGHSPASDPSIARRQSFFPVATFIFTHLRGEAEPMPFCFQLLESTTFI
jgi:hypothetical protein